MSDWDGRGLPPQATARVSRIHDSHVSSSLLSVAGQAGLDACGFVPVAEVMGCVVEHIGWQGYGGCGWGYGYGYGSYAPTSTITQNSGGYFGFGPFLDALNAGWNGALDRMLIECRSLGADGVVGVTVEERSLGEGNREFLAMGTPVRSLGKTHVDRPFSTTLPGQDLAKLLHGGWTPVAVVVPIAVGIRHDDYQTRQATFAFSTNQEVPGYSELVHAVRAECRRELGRRSASHGAEGSIITTPMRLHVHEVEVGEGHRDHVGQASLVATAIARYGPPSSPSRALTILQLKDKHEVGK